jgi:glycosyltransferase involved in cell wall biosynthesis
MSRLAVIVPAFDEAESVGGVVRGIRSAVPQARVIVVDDGSGDATAQVARAAGARVLRLPFNCGIGAAVQAGLRLALEGDAQLFARLDGDAQHDPADLPRLVARCAAQPDCDFALGSRFLDRGGFQTSWPRRLGSRWFATLLRRFCGVRVTDPTSGFWIANRAAASALCACYASDYPEVDALVHLARRGLRIAEEPVAMRARSAGRSSIDAPAAVYYMIKVTVALAMVRLERRARDEPATPPP